MVLSRLKLKNFKSFKDKEFNFAPGLTGLLGRNGSGKSTVFEAIIFALYGECNTKKELLKNSSALDKEALEAELCFEIDSKEYVVKRQLRGKNLIAKSSLIDGSGEEIASGSKETTLEIIKLTGMNKEAFENTVYASQKELAALSNLKSEERKKIIRRLLGLEKIDFIEKELALKIRELKREIKSFEEILLSSDEIKNINLKIENFKNDLEKKQKLLTNAQKEYKNITARAHEAFKKAEYFQNLKEGYVKLKNQIEQLRLKEANTLKNLQKESKNLEQLLTEERFFNSNKEALNRYKELQEKMQKHQKTKEMHIKKEGLKLEQETLRKQLAGLKKEHKKLKKEILKKELMLNLQKAKELSLKTVNENLNSLQKRRNSILKEHSSAQALIENSKKQLAKIKKLGKNSPCPVCTRPLLNEFDEVVNSLTKNINTLTQNSLKKLTKTLQEIDIQIEEKLSAKTALENDLKKIYGNLKTIESLENRLKDIEKKEKDVLQQGLKNKDEINRLEKIKYNPQEHQKVEDEFKQTEAVYKKLLTVQRLIEQIPKIKETINEQKKELKNLQKKIETEEKNLKEHKYNPKEEEDAKKGYQEILKSKDAKQTEIKNLEVELAKLKEQINAQNGILKQNSQHKQKLKSKELDREDYEKIKLLLTDFKNRINSKITPRISKIASDMFYEVTDGKYQLIEVDEEFNFYIYDEGKRYPIERFSGGEVDLANLILRIAISKTLNELSSNTNIGFLAFDEIFGSQDEQRRYAIMESFNKIKENYRQIFLISHEKEIKEMFERVIEM